MSRVAGKRKRVRFRQIAPLGAGGMAEVHLATMARGSEQRLVALKRLHKHVLMQPGNLEMFQREARISSLLSHPHIVAVEDFGADAQGPYIALEYVSGRPASALIRARKHIDPLLLKTAVLRVIGDAARAVAHAHAFVDHGAGITGVVHRDISLDNLLVSYEGVAKLADFGIALMVGATRVTQTGVLKGKFGFMAPELFDGQQADQRTDVFALAAASFQLLTGMKPFAGNTDAEIVRAVLAAKAPSLSALRPDLPPGVIEWVDRGLQKSPEDRLPPARLAAIIDQALAREPNDGRDALVELMDVTFPAGIDARRAATSKLVLRHTKSVERGRRYAVVRWAGAALACSVALGTAGFVLTQQKPPVVVDTELAVEPAEPLHPGRLEVAEPTPQADVPAPVPPDEPPPLALEPVRLTAEPTVAPMRSPAPSSSRKKSRVVSAVRRVPEAKKTGTLLLRIQPWAKVLVDGTPRGTTPMAPLTLPVGRHSVVLINDELGVKRTVSVRVEENRQQVLKLALP